MNTSLSAQPMKVRIHYDPPDNRKPTIVDLPAVPSKGDEVVDREGLVASVETLRFAPWDTEAQIHVFLNPLIPDTPHEPERRERDDDDE